MQKLHWISNILLQNKSVRASAPNFENSLANSGETVWACLRHAHTFDSSFPFCTKLESLLNEARTHFSKNLSSNLISRAERFVVWNVIVRSTTNSVTAQRPFHRAPKRCSAPLPLFRVRPRLATVFILGFLARLPFWFGMSVAVSGGVFFGRVILISKYYFKTN